MGPATRAQLAPGTLGRQARIAVAASVPVLVLASCGMAGVVQSGSASPVAAVQPAPAHSSAAVPRPERVSASKSAGSAHGPAATSCRAVVHIGDSTSDGLISPDYLPDPRQRIAAQYARRWA